MSTGASVDVVLLVIGSRGSGRAELARQLLRLPPDAPVRGLAELQSGEPQEDAVVLDCVTTWVRERVAGGLDPGRAIQDAVGELRRTAEQVGVAVLIAPEAETDEALHQQTLRALSRLASRAVLVVAGRAVELGNPLPVTAESAARPARRPAARRVPVRVETVPEDHVDLASLRHDERPPPQVRAALARVRDDQHPDDERAREAVAVATGLTSEHVVLLAGASAAPWLLAHALAPERAAVIHPAEPDAEEAMRACGVAVTRVPRDARARWRLRPDRVPDDADLVVLANPASPTGTLDEPADIAALRRPGRTVLLDETGMDFVLDGRSSLAGRVGDGGGILVVVRSLSVLWGLAGLRAGFAVTDPSTAATLRAHQPPWPLSARAVAALSACLEEEAHRQEVAEGVARRRRAMVRRLSRVPEVVVHEGAANTVLLEVDGGRAVHRALLARGVSVRASTYPLLGGRFLRVTVRGADEVEVLAAALEEILAPAG